MRVVDAVAQHFVNEGVEHYFGYIGGTIWPFLDALIDKPQLKGIQPKHEAAAVQMADVYYRLKHKVAPVIVTKGPGVLEHSLRAEQCDARFICRCPDSGRGCHTIF